MKDFIDLVTDGLNADENSISLDMELISDIGLDSLSLLDLLSELEDHYEIEFDSRAIQKFVTLQDVYDYISDKG